MHISKRIISIMLVIIMIFSISPNIFASQLVSTDDYSENAYDGLVGGDSSNNYGWCTAEFQQNDGDYLWVGVNRDFVQRLPTADSTNEEILNGVISGVFGGSPYYSTYNTNNPVHMAALETQAAGIYRLKLGDPTAKFELVWKDTTCAGYRKMYLGEDGNLYAFTGVANNIDGTRMHYIYRFNKDFKFGDTPEIVFSMVVNNKNNRDLIQLYNGEQLLRGCAVIDGHLYIGTMGSDLYRTIGTPGDLQNLGIPGELKTTNTTGWEKVTLPNSFYDKVDLSIYGIPGYSGIIDIKPPIWDVKDFNDKLYIFGAGRNATIYVFDPKDGSCIPIMANQPGAKYNSGFGYNYAAFCGFKYNGEFYLASMINPMMPIAMMMYGMLDFLENQSIQTLITAFDEIVPAIILHVNKETGDLEIVVGDDDTFFDKNGNELARYNGSTERGGFFQGNTKFNSSMNGYIWWMSENLDGDKLYASTYDMFFLIQSIRDIVYNELMKTFDESILGELIKVFADMSNLIDHTELTEFENRLRNLIFQLISPEIPMVQSFRTIPGYEEITTEPQTIDSKVKLAFGDFELNNNALNSLTNAIQLIVDEVTDKPYEEITTAITSEEPTTITSEEEPITTPFDVEEPTTITSEEEPVTTPSDVEEPTTITSEEEPATTPSDVEEPTTIISEEEPTDTTSDIEEPNLIRAASNYTNSFLSIDGISGIYLQEPSNDILYEDLLKKENLADQIALLFLCTMYMTNTTDKAGFDLYVTEDGGITWNPITINGFDTDAYGGRVIVPTSYGTYITTADPITGCSVWRIEDLEPSITANTPHIFNNNELSYGPTTFKVLDLSNGTLEMDWDSDLVDFEIINIEYGTMKDKKLNDNFITNQPYTLYTIQMTPITSGEEDVEVTFTSGGLSTTKTIHVTNTPPTDLSVNVYPSSRYCNEGEEIVFEIDVHNNSYMYTATPVSLDIDYNHSEFKFIKGDNIPDYFELEPGETKTFKLKYKALKPADSSPFTVTVIDNTPAPHYDNNPDNNTQTVNIRINVDTNANINDFPLIIPPYGYSSNLTSPYLITINDVKGGTVKSSHSQAYAGQVITLTVSAENDKEISSVSVTDYKDSKVALTNKGDGVYTFTMPSSQVYISAAFTDIEVIEETTVVTETVEPEIIDEEIESEENCPSSKFIDVDPDMWYHEAIDYVINEKIFIGTSDNEFSPNQTMNRAMVAQILYNIAGKPDIENTVQIFDDVTEADWFASAVVWATENGWLLGYGDGNFGPLDSITREQFILILYRYQGSPELSDDDLSILSNYSDSNDVSSWAVSAMAWAVANDLLVIQDGLLNPNGAATRAEIAQTLFNLDIN